VTTATSPDPLIGTHFDRYRVLEKLGEGGMGAVYAVEHLLLRKRLAMKVLRLDIAENEEIAARFHNEAIAVSRIHHEHVVEVTDFGWLEDGRPYLVMEELRGRSLAEILALERRLSLPRALRFVEQVAQALAAAHAAGVVHRDLKPANVFVMDAGHGEQVKVLDFGISKVRAQDLRLTRLGRVVGTPEYMSPEQGAGLEVDARSDVYALGVLLFELVTGRPPFLATNPVEVLMMHQSTQPPLLQQVRPDLPVSPALEALVSRLLAKRPSDRPQTMDQCLAALRPLSAEVPRPSSAAQGDPGADVPLELLAPTLTAVSLDPREAYVASRLAGLALTLPELVRASGLPQPEALALVRSLMAKGVVGPRPRATPQTDPENRFAESPRRGLRDK